MKSILLRASTDPVSRKVFEHLSSARARFGYLKAAFRKEAWGLLQAMPYEQFLRTTYWIIIRDYLLSVRPRECARCGRRGLLIAHHLTYDSHGLEHLHLDDLELVCKECHEDIHRPADERLKGMFAELADLKRFQHRPLFMDNPNYDPRTIMNLHDYGDIRGRIHE